MSPSTDVAAEARKLPRADRLLEAAERAGLVARLGHQPVMEAVRAELESRRAAVLAGAPCPPAGEIEAALVARLEGEARGALRRAINATGVVIHTNLGRAPSRPPPRRPWPPPPRATRRWSSTWSAASGATATTTPPGPCAG